MKKKIWAAVAAAVLILGVVGIKLYSGIKFEPKRQRENQIIAYHDSNAVELYYHNYSEETEEIWIQLLIDGDYDVASETVKPDETVEVAYTVDGKPYSAFKAGVYSGRILVFDAENGELKNRVTDLEFRLYDSVNDAYDAITTPEEITRDIVLDEEETRPQKYDLEADLRIQEMYGLIRGLTAEDRELDSRVYAVINGENVLLAEIANIPPRSIYTMMELLPGAAEKMSPGENYEGWVDSVYSDTGEAYDSVPASIRAYSTIPQQNVEE